MCFSKQSSKDDSATSILDHAMRSLSTDEMKRLELFAFKSQAPATRLMTSQELQDRYLWLWDPLALVSYP